MRAFTTFQATGPPSIACLAAVAAFWASFHCFLVCLRLSSKIRLNQCRVRPQRMFSTSVTADFSSIPSAMYFRIWSRMALRRPYQTRILGSWRQRGPHNASMDSSEGFPLRPYRHSSHTSGTVSRLLCSTMGGSLALAEGVNFSSTFPRGFEGPGLPPVAEPVFWLDGDPRGSRRGVGSAPSRTEAGFGWVRGVEYWPRCGVEKEELVGAFNPSGVAATGVAIAIGGCAGGWGLQIEAMSCGHICVSSIRGAPNPSCAWETHTLDRLDGPCLGSKAGVDEALHLLQLTADGGILGSEVSNLLGVRSLHAVDDGDEFLGALVPELVVPCTIL